ncbi:MAG TPA: hypothetical protein VD706_01270 [Candidatus Saccharimonadales bacterium]|nr:hypothetical protein [Candidatus Saccharimonadales bacterium]
MCGAVFSTHEAVQYESVWQVRKDMRLRPFSRLKLLLSLYKSCEHRKTALSDAEGLTETVIRKLPGLMREGTVSSQDIARVAMVALHRFDTAASSHYQAYHKG